MDLQAQLHSGENRGLNIDHQVSRGDGAEGLRGMLKGLIEWLNEQLPNLNLPAETSLETFRACLLGGPTLGHLLNSLSPGAVEMGVRSEYHLAIVERFLSTLDKMGLPGFEVSDLEQGSMVKVLECLHELKSYFTSDVDRGPAHNRERSWNLPQMESTDGSDSFQADEPQSTKFGPEKRRNSWGSKFQTVLHNTALSGNLGPDVKISDLVKWNSLDKAPTQLLFSMIERVMDESFERKSADLFLHLACLQQNSLYKSREGKYQSRVKALETLAVGASEESEVAVNHLWQIKTEKIKLEEKKEHDEQNVLRLIGEKDERDAEIGALRQELEAAKISYGKHCLRLESQAKDTKAELGKKIKDLECLLALSTKKMREFEEISEYEIQKLKNRELRYHCFVDSHFGFLQELREDLDSVRREVLKTREWYPVEFQHLGMKLKELLDAAENYHVVLAENRKLYNEVQDLKGNIRVYCRIRPFLPGQNEKHTAIEYIGENGELVVVNPLKQGKDSRRLFKFNKVFGPTANQEDVFKDTQPLIQSVLDGYNVCIFAYGQTGSGKTYTMTGPDMALEKDWGVNYRALHDLFQISQSRRSSILYEVGLQMVEIYNEQVRDLLTSDGSQKKYPFLRFLGSTYHNQPNGLAVPDASMHHVNSTYDVLELMKVGFMNRAIGATALNERSSRSHSILTVHVRGTDLKNDSVLRGCLHLVDLAGSERVDRSEAAGDRLREAQHINKSLSALGDVIFALAQKNSHVPYRNSKLTQVLQSSLGGQAKTIMFVQLNPDVESYSETISTLKFAERVSGVELGAAHSNKEGRDVRELMDQVHIYGAS
ncbi:hypothetical protein Cgig2_001771 [Carnegiea gigantea]|uniref:Kinesin heavy chain n=1 Tax=Carnegiea gigantea TaxID=171969 RepID=A0A9Q1KAQ6_9CARY|nr:hypothetical protein Cgig2_001771 [Carnegiea gigantea]